MVLAADSAPQAHGTAAAPWLEGYAPLAGGWDECIAPDGRIRQHWHDAVNAWTERGADERARRRLAADRYLLDNGVAHRVYGDATSTERPWPLSHVPLILSHEEWTALEAGLIQRAELLERVVADLYGAQHLVRGGHLPAPLVAAAPGFLPPLVGAAPAGGNHLHAIAIEVGRGPDGRWWVLGDRTQAPSGAGYALENRLALSRSLGEDLTRLQVQRLAPFFQALRAALGRMRGPDSARVGLLTPGPFNETYYEQAFLARYLGLLLLEGGDLLVRDDTLYVRTVRGLRKVDALWRRVDASYCDPIELRPDSRLGVPGLVRAIRAGTVTCVNALGAGLLESRFFMAFMPALARHLLGEELKLPNIATWWLGDPAAADAARHAGTGTVTLTATGTSLPVDGRHLSADALDPAGPDHPDALWRVAQEVVHLSTLPARPEPAADGREQPLVPRPFSLRLFLARTPDGWAVMPGGFARVSDSADTRALSMQDGSHSADVWVRSPVPVAPATLLPAPGSETVRRVPGTLPARAADNLFWLGRYTERAQLDLRLARGYLSRRLEGLPASDPMLQAVAAQLGRWGIPDPEAPDLFRAALLPELERARAAASAIRDRFSPDAWQSLNRFVGRARAGGLDHLSTIECIDAALAMLAGFAGLIGENMIRLSGWRFLEIGRRLERATGTAQSADALMVRSHHPGALDLMLEIADSLMSYRQRYSVTTDPRTVADLIVLDPNNPRSIAFQLERIHLHIDEITDHKAFDQTTDLQKLAFSTWSIVHTASAERVDERMMRTILNSLQALSQAITATYLAPSSGMTGERDDQP